MTYDVIVDGKTHRLELTKGEKAWLCKVDDQQIEVDAVLTARDVMSILHGGDAFEVKRERPLAGDILQRRPGRCRGEAGPQKITAPMPGKIVRVMVSEKDEVKAGQGVIVMEAMKMQNEMKSPKDGRVQKILTSEGATVNAGDSLAVIE